MNTLSKIKTPEQLRMEADAADDAWEPVPMIERRRRARDGLALISDATQILDRTTRIVKRLMPNQRTPHGFYDPQGFVAAANYHGAREKLFAQVQKRISEKVRGL